MIDDKNSRRNKIEQHMMSLRKWGSENTEQYSALEAELEELQDPKASHPLTIPGELLAEASKLGHTSFEQDGNGWTASLVMKTEHSYKYVQGVGSAPAEALQSAIDKARDAVGGVSYRQQ